jgi:hypothetical protein
MERDGSMRIIGKHLRPLLARISSVFTVFPINPHKKRYLFKTHFPLQEGADGVAQGVPASDKSHDLEFWKTSPEDGCQIFLVPFMDSQ